MRVTPAASAAGAGLVSVSTTRKGRPWIEGGAFTQDGPGAGKGNHFDANAGRVVGPEGNLVFAPAESRESSWVPVDSLKVDTAEARFTRLQKGVGISGKLQQMETSGGGYQVLFVTLTYRNGDDWRGTHLTAYMDKVRNHYRACTREKLRYVWVAETQERGAIHYHVIFWVRRTYFMPKADKKGWWPHGMTKTEKARQSGGSVVYLMGYIKKHKSKEGLPHGARIFGVGGLSAAGRGVRRWVHLPSFLQARYDCTQRVMRAPGGGWVAADGTRWASEWGVSAFGNGYTRLLRLRTYPSTGIEPVGPFTYLAGSAAA